MIEELAISGALSATGFAVLLFLRCELRAALIWLSLPVGAIVYLMVALVLVTATGTLDPQAGLGGSVALGAIAIVESIARRRWNTETLVWASLAILLVAVVVVLARTFHLTRLTVDSVRYLVIGADLQLDHAMGQINDLELVTRQVGLPSLHALSSLTDRRYFTSIGPLFGVSGIGLFVWFVWRVTSDLIRRHRFVLVLAAALFVLSSNRLVFDVFYINTHIQVAVFMLIAVAGSWLALTSNQRGWMVLAGLALGATLLLRPEAPLVAALVLVTVGATRVSWPDRVAIVLPTIFFASLWYGVILWQYAAEGNVISLTAPVFASLVVLTGSVVVVLAGGLPRLSGIVAYADGAMLGALILTLVGLAVVNFDIFAASIAASFQNVALSKGAWLLTWSIAVPLLVLALVVHRVPEAKLWTTPIVGFAVIWLLLPMVREGAWRVGTGDSGNRILAHMLLIVVTFLVLAAVRSWSETASGEVTESSALGRGLSNGARAVSWRRSDPRPR